MKNKLSRILFLILTPLIPLLVLIPAWNPNAAELAFSGRDTGVGTPSVQIEDFVRYNMPQRDRLRQWSLDIIMVAGQREIVERGYRDSAVQNGIFIGQNGLMKNIDPPITAYVQENTDGIIEFAERMREESIPVYVALIPTSGAILQRDLPRYAQSVMVNQKKLIDDAYGKIAGSASTVDVYGALINRQQQYIYYRTENNLTALGGYFVYAAMIGRLEIGVPALSQFDIDYAETEFYGDLCEQSGYRDISPDFISLFRYGAANRSSHEYLVTHINGGETKTYHTLFPKHTAVIGHELDVYLGGISAVTDIRTSTASSARTLVFGDKTAKAYLPFLANNCSRVTLVDLFHSPQELSSVDILQYNRIIFAYGMESFLHTNIPSRATGLIKEE